MTSLPGSYFRLLLTISLGLILITAGSCELIEIGNLEKKLPGTWTVTDASLEISAGGLEIIEYMVTRLHYNGTKAEAKIDSLTTGMLDEITGRITFTDEFTYEANELGNIPVSGAWQVSEDELYIILNGTTPGSDSITIRSLLNKMIIISLPPDYFQVDLDNDGALETSMQVVVVETLNKN